MFVDEATIQVRAGKGGNGSASFRREKFIPRGGPDGGDGGDGGSVYVVIRESMHGLARIQAHRSFIAQSGDGGRGKKLHGRNGESIEIEVPPGTVIYEQGPDGEKLVVDLGEYKGDRFRVARGGRGGRGNVHFANAVNQAPTYAAPGVPGEEKTLHLVVQHLADVGLVGLPNAGKSTLLGRLSHAKPKVADYPFTTLEPHLGMVDIEGDRIVMADIPGIIEGASQGKGLGHKFLRHLMRTTILVHLVDAQQEDPAEAYKIIRRELAEFDPHLATLPEIVCVSRIDTLSADDKLQLLQQLHHLHPIALSSVSGEGIEELLRMIAQRFAQQPLDNI